MADKIHIKDRQTVIPGDLLAEGMSYLPGGKAFREKDRLFSSVIGLASIKGRVIKVIPLAGKYIPQKGDVVIGKITGMGFSGWHLDIFAPYPADLNVADATRDYIDLSKTMLSSYFDIDDYVLAEIINVPESKFVKLTTKNRMYKKLAKGNIIHVSPTKIPRIIGKQGSMINMLKNGSGCEIIVGQNGVVWINGEPEKIALATKAVKIIEKDSHKEGLTDRIKKLLEVKDGKSRKA